MRRKTGELLPIETSILAAAVELQQRGQPEFHGFAIAKQLREREGARQLTAHGTLYKALNRLEQAGLLTSSWEEPQAAAGQQRPRRRLYQLTALGERALPAARRLPTPTALPAAAQHRPAVS
jgi:PadR family transcriptional regulator PadR